MTTPSSDHYEAGSEYILSRDKAERKRLDDQHRYMSILLFESRLIYNRRVVLAPGSSVLDAGTGTGIWLQELSKRVPPTVELYGCDVSPDNFPAQHAENIHFHVSSVTSLPQEWSNKFDLVNQRLLIGGLRVPEWSMTMSELYRVLKPGGHIQLAETDLAHLVDPLAGPTTKRFMDLCAILFNKAGLLLGASSRLEGLLRDAGFDEVKSEEKYLVLGRAWGEVGELGRQTTLDGFRKFGPSFVRHGILGAEKELHSLVDDMEKEWDSAIEGYRIMAHVATARKPL